MYFQKIIVYKIPPGGRGVYSQLKAYTALILLLQILAALYYRYKPVGQVIIGDLGNNDDSGVRSFVSGDLFKGYIAYTDRRMS